MKENWYKTHQEIAEIVDRLDSGSFVLKTDEEVRNALESTLVMVKTLLTNTDLCLCEECRDRLRIVGNWLTDIGAIPKEARGGTES
jgi:hypothetical protein